MCDLPKYFKVDCTDYETVKRVLDAVSGRSFKWRGPGTPIEGDYPSEETRYLFFRDGKVTVSYSHEKNHFDSVDLTELSPTFIINAASPPEFSELSFVSMLGGE